MVHNHWILGETKKRYSKWKDNYIKCWSVWQYSRRSREGCQNIPVTSNITSTIYTFSQLQFPGKKDKMYRSFETTKAHHHLPSQLSLNSTENLSGNPKELNVQCVLLSRYNILTFIFLFWLKLFVLYDYLSL